jgi:hypothetical protein
VSSWVRAPVVGLSTGASINTHPPPPPREVYRYGKGKQINKITINYIAVQLRKCEEAMEVFFR